MSPTIGGGGSSIRSLRHSSPPSADPYLFTVCVGLKPSNAHYFLNSTDEVLRSLYGLVLRDQEEKGNASAAAKDESKASGGKKLGLSKRITAITNEASGLGVKRGSFGALTSLLFGGKKE
jgi:hypothetical protein